VANLVVEAAVVPLEEARRRGAMALFGEKYGDRVRMIRIGDVSLELCGGTHVHRTGDIGVFRIISEGSVAAGIRRIEAVTGPEALKWWYETEDLLGECASLLKTNPATLPRRVRALLEELKALKQKKAKGAGGTELERGEERVGPVSVQWRVVTADSLDELRSLWDSLRNRLAGTVLVLFGKGEKGTSVLVCLSPDLRGKTGIHCGKLARAAGKAMGAGGGGRADMGQAGGRDPEAVPQALEVLLTELRTQIG